jgi:hypothetical protein
MNVAEVLKDLEDLNPDALLLEPRDVYDPALIGITDLPNDSWPRKDRIHVAIYDSDKCIEAIMGWMGCDYNDAVDWFGFNTSGAWVGEGTPTFSFPDPDAP